MKKERARCVAAIAVAALLVLASAGRALAVCGDGTLDVGEACDQGGANGTPTSCCTALCGFAAADTVCRPGVDFCDLTELCTGADGSCPPDAMRAAGAECRAVAGPCDVAEQCDGSSTACPADALRPAGAECRAVAGGCDLPEACTGTSAACPANVVEPAGTVCRPSAGVCDVAELCNGLSPSCPLEVFVPGGTVCRAAVDVCDVTETCSGAGPTCPVDGLRAAGTVCHPSTGGCDPAETCSGLDALCPVDVLQPLGAVCRAASDPCDVDEQCDGTTALCPADVVIPDGTSCDDGSSCTLSDACSTGVCRGTVDINSCEDAFICYRSRAGSTAAVDITPVTLTDPFETRDFQRLLPRTLCTPADENDGDGVLDAATHLVGYPIRNVSLGFSPRIRHLAVTNWAGLLTVDTGRPDLLLVPAAKDLHVSPAPPAPGSHQVNNYKCYLAKTSPGTPKFQSKVLFVTLTDQFAVAKRIGLGKPRHVCFPTDVDGEEIIDSIPKLLCYVAKPRQGEPLSPATRTHVADQFGAFDLSTIREREICLPSRIE